MAKPHRLHALCPYFAMFPPSFARSCIETLTGPGDLVLDPFCGRGTTLLETLLLGREAIALDVNPVATCVTGAKARTPDLATTEAKVDELESEFRQYDKTCLQRDASELPPFFLAAFHPETLLEILFLRGRLRWRERHLDRFVAALALGSLHGEMEKSPSYFSNQMPRTISTKPRYSINYWHTHGLAAQRRAVFEILRARARLRLKNRLHKSGVVLNVDARCAYKALPNYRERVKAIVTSPPYLNVTNFEEDQWLRLWFLGGPPHPTYHRVSRDDRYSAPAKYWRFLAEAFRGIAPLMSRDAVLACRIGSKRLSAEAIGHGLFKVVRSAFPEASLGCDPCTSKPNRRQTTNFRPSVRECAVEYDFVFRLN